ncbi:MAG: hypothetical protein MZU97_08515 [Bacillus subtilis]|nr:hypothetical protein [Bacillus subtilis]
MSPAGRFLDRPIAINFGIEYDGIRYGLPFGLRHTDFQYIEQHEAFDRVVFRCRDFRIGIEADFAFVSPFYPQDKALSTMPALYVEIVVKRIIDRGVRADDAKTIQVFCDARMTPFVEDGPRLFMEDRYFLADDHIHYQDMEYLKRFLNEHPDVRNGVVGSTAIGSIPGGVVLGKSMLVQVDIAQGNPEGSSMSSAGMSKIPFCLPKKRLGGSITRTSFPRFGTSWRRLLWRPRTH